MKQKNIQTKKLTPTAMYASHTSSRLPNIQGVKRELLKALALMGTLAVHTSPARRLRLAEDILYGDLRTRRTDNVNQSLNRLTADGLVVARKTKGDAVLTRAGKEYIRYLSANEIEIHIPKRWNGVWHMVMFDIPEEIKHARDALRFHLKRLGFREYQKSVFVYPYPCEKEVRELVSLHGIEAYVQCVEARFIDNEQKMKKAFGLNTKTASLT